MTIERVSPEDTGYDELNEIFRDGAIKRFNYGQLADEYNSAPVDAILMAEFNNNARLSNIAAVMETYEVIQDVDFKLSKVQTNLNDEGEVSSHIIGIKKMTMNPMRRD